jgi:hypothetical protein
MTHPGFKTESTHWEKRIFLRTDVTKNIIKKIVIKKNRKGTGSISGSLFHNLLYSVQFTVTVKIAFLTMNPAFLLLIIRVPVGLHYKDLTFNKKGLKQLAKAFCIPVPVGYFSTHLPYRYFSHLYTFHCTYKETQHNAETQLKISIRKALTKYLCIPYIPFAVHLFKNLLWHFSSWFSIRLNVQGIYFYRVPTFSNSLPSYWLSPILLFQLVHKRLIKPQPCYAINYCLYVLQNFYTTNT